MLDLHAYLNRLASAEPTPGGGSAAALVGAFSAGLVAMVARITLGSAKHANVHPAAVLLIEQADALRAQFVAARPHDEAAYAAVVAAQALPRGSAEQNAARSAELQAALGDAAAAPLHVARLCAELFAAVEAAAELRNVHLMSDVECALAFARATLDASAANVRVNHRFLKDAALVDTQARQLAAIAAQAQTAEARTTAAFAVA